MKKFFALSLSALMLALAVPSFAGGPYDVGEIKGTPRKQGEPVRTYKLVRFSTRGPNIASLTSNDVVVYDTNSGDGVSVRTTTTSADASIAGIVSMTIPSADSASTNAFDDAGKRNWGFILVHGPAKAKASAGGTNGAAAGTFWITSKDSGAITGVESLSSNDAAAVRSAARVSGGVGGVFFDSADGSSTSYDVFVRLE